MQWELVLATIAVLVMLEGLVAFVNPDWARGLVRRLAQMTVPQWRLMGLIALTVGVVLLTMLRVLD